MRQQHHTGSRPEQAQHSTAAARTEQLRETFPVWPWPASAGDRGWASGMKSRDPDEGKNFGTHAQMSFP